MYRRKMFGKIQQRGEYSLINMQVIASNCAMKDSDPEDLLTARNPEHCQAACHSEFLLYKRPLNKIIEAKIVLKPLYRVLLRRNLQAASDSLKISTIDSVLCESGMVPKGQKLDSFCLDKATYIKERPRHSPTEKTFCEKKLNGKVARWSGSEELESNEAAEKTIIANGQRHTLAEKFRISNGFSNAPKEPLAECSFILPSFNQHAIIIFKTIVSSSTSLNLMAPSQNAETEEAERKQTSECSLDKSEVKINLNCIVQSTSEITKEAHRLMNGGDVHETNQKAVGLLSFFGNKAVDEQVGDVAEEFKLAHVILIVAGIGGAIGIGYYFYSRYK